MKYEMRDLQFNDVFKMSKILKKIGVKDEIGQLTKGIKADDRTVESVGKEIIFKLIITALENLGNAQKEVNDFLGSLINISGKEFGELPLEVSFDVISQFKNKKGVIDFFTQAVS